MDYSYIFSSAKLKKDSLERAGFTSSDGVNYEMKKPAAKGAFFAEIKLSIREQTLSLQLFDSATGERYVLFDMPGAHGSFLASLREEAGNCIEEIRSKCFDSKDLREPYLAFIKSEFSVEADFPWDDSPDACVFRCPNKKWFGLMMKVKYRQLGLTGDEEVWVVNIKADENLIPELVDRKSIFPAWHMNKKYWITILLTGVTDFEKLCGLTRRSYELVEKGGKSKKLRKGL